MAKKQDPRDHHRRRDRHRAAIARGKPPCALCGEPIDYRAHWLHPDAFEIDHIVPIAHGGADGLSNKQPSHRRCNREKSSDVLRRRPAVSFVTDRNWTVRDTGGI